RVNLPNYLTLSRIASVPVLIWLLSPKLPWFADVLGLQFLQQPGVGELAAAGLFILASITDGVDGYLARKRNQVTTLGMLLDPLADKLMVAGAFIALVQYNPSVVPAWIAVLVIAREFLVSGLRSIASSEGFTIEASDLGKFKMVVQIVAIVAAIIHHHWLTLEFGLFHLDVEIIARTAMWIMVGISSISAADYFIAFWKKIDRSVQQTARRPFVLSRRKKRLEASAAAEALASDTLPKNAE
ncbi:MAG TPA: CDP-diacylglycerol--glycerol-3-phosphate 3-phosphatidyltransferase, partial [Terriglobales bacterium]|nr:CDP-diacylglycerol--glycerol-3-phosphate 3-phosphatidyltransferase [Terriglobales bacterium]